jgi:hypothetical protein
MEEELHGRLHRIRFEVVDVIPGREISYRVGRWLCGRFHIEPATGADQGMVVVDRDGTERRDRAAGRLVLSRLPLTFWVVAPIRLWADRR